MHVISGEAGSAKSSIGQNGYIELQTLKRMNRAETLLITLTSSPLAPAHTSTPRPKKKLFAPSFRSSCGGTTLNPVLPGHHSPPWETLSDVFQASVVPQSNGIATLVLLPRSFALLPVQVVRAGMEVWC